MASQRRQGKPYVFTL